MYVWVYTAEVNAKRIRERYLRAVVRQDIPFFDKVGAGEVATRIQTDAHLVQQGMSEKVSLVVSFLSAFATGFILVYIRNAGNIAEEVVSTVRTAQAFGAQRILSSLYDQHVAKSKVVDVKSTIWLGGSLSVFFFCIYSSCALGAYKILPFTYFLLAFSFGTTLILCGDANAGTVIIVFMAILIGSFSLALLAPEMQAITHGRGAAAKFYATIDRVPDIDSADLSGEKPETVYGEVTFEDIHFNYPSRPDIAVVKGINLTFRAGKTAALVGASGSGKSTVISLIERFYDPLSGVVKLDGRELKFLNVRWLRWQIGLVSQEPTLFATTIRGNVEHGLIGTKYENASEEEKLALINGGQKQHVAIASDPRILLLDEATSALDTQSEGIVQDALDQASAGHTTCCPFTPQYVETESSYFWFGFLHNPDKGVDCPLRLGIYTPPLSRSVTPEPLIDPQLIYSFLAAIVLSSPDSDARHETTHAWDSAESSKS
ncbi:P-loop containing nucleoside triphosphate hydrolase protein [Guyanagaster necrorhizus]|uniref:P-loop containing nucleoside triphosphate hydrolase protein n=1 Tax=Guyanagaster necrorhizus TaxID=856835 RepID=A0A9P7VYB8_9AGAR|nr:P-loop containing nucleoside triphosphate hydrolase protein [Guyanagaster necrorhizus MCA 3950]KAG7448812.1 P-loop containing nucleoside triphosphate hydrolase protein [Guyanagaster necrorhizus MCA 3950]